MKNLKKVLALVLACTMVFGLVATASTGYPDVADDATYAEAVKLCLLLRFFRATKMVTLILTLRLPELKWQRFFAQWLNLVN